MRRILLLVVLAALPGGAAEVSSTDTTPSPSDPATARQQFSAALAGAPAIAAARTRAMAAERAQGAAGVLPDPVVGIDVGRERTRRGDEMTMYGAMVEQALPRWGERDALRQAALAQVRQEEAQVATVLGDHAASVATAIAEWQAARATQALVEQSRDRIAALREVVRARLAAGGALVGDQLALDTRAQHVDLQLADLERRQADAEAMVRGQLGLSAEAPLPPFAAPDPASLRGESNPQIRTAEALQQEALAMEHEALARGRPETAIGVAWEQTAAGTPDQSDQVSLTFRLSLPLHRSAYDDAAQAARLRARAARHEAGSATWMARSQVSRAQRAVAQAERAERTAAEIAARTRAEYDAVLRQVASGGATVTASLDLLDRITESGVAAVMARLDSHLALAELWRLAPPDLPPRTDDGDAERPHHLPPATTP